MAKKQATTTSTASTKTASGAATARAAAPAKPRTSRVSTAKHSKSAVPEASVSPAAIAIEIPAEQPVESVLEVVEAKPVIEAKPVLEAKPVVAENRHEAVSRIAYGYYVARGYRPGNPHEDWVRAEREYSAGL